MIWLRDLECIKYQSKYQFSTERNLHLTSLENKRLICTIINEHSLKNWFCNYKKKIYTSNIFINFIMVWQFLKFFFLFFKNNFNQKTPPFCIWKKISFMFVLIAKCSYYYICIRVKLLTRLTKIHLWWDSWTKLHLWHTKWTCFRLLSHGVL